MEIPDLLSREKRKKIDALLEQDHCFLHLTPSSQGCVLPESLVNQPAVSLKISRRFKGSLQLAATRIEASLKFPDDYFECHIPYSAIWAVTSAEGKTIAWELPHQTADDSSSNNDDTSSTTKDVNKEPEHSKGSEEKPKSVKSGSRPKLVRIK